MMKKIIIVGLLGVAAMSTLYVVIPYVVGARAPSTSLRIAIFTPTTHCALQEIEQGFVQILQELSGTSYLFTTFNANGNRTLLRAQAEEIVGGDYALIFTIGAACSQTVAELIAKKGMHTPHVFGGVDGPEFAQSLAHSNATSTGVYVKSDYKRAMDILQRVKPDMKNVLLVYDPTHGTGLEKHKKEIEAHLKKRGVALRSVEIYQTNEIQQKVAAALPNADVVLVLTDNTVVAGIDALIVLCNRYGVTLFASDLGSGKKGAALAYGVTEYDSGSGAAHKADAILVHGAQPNSLAVSVISNFRLELNRDTADAQGIHVDVATLHHLQHQGDDHA